MAALFVRVKQCMKVTLPSSSDKNSSDIFTWKGLLCIQNRQDVAAIVRIQVGLGWDTTIIVYYKPATANQHTAPQPLLALCVKHKGTLHATNLVTSEKRKCFMKQSRCS